MIPTILLCIAIIVASVGTAKPYGWVSLTLGVLALLTLVTNFRLN